MVRYAPYADSWTRFAILAVVARLRPRGGLYGAPGLASDHTADSSVALYVLVMASVAALSLGLPPPAGADGRRSP
jgi:hypothetical protein